MQCVKQRNPYLKRMLSQTPHKYSYDLNSGKHYLLTPDGKEKEINKIGTFKPTFRKNFTGFIGHKQRYIESNVDSTALHYVPDLSFNQKKCYHYPMLKKFAGYAQYPYKLGPFPQHLKSPQIKPNYHLKKSKSQHEKKQQKQKQKSKSIILQNSHNTFINENNTSDKFFQMSFSNMTTTKPLPKQAKKTCYNYKCKFLKQFIFDQKGKTQISTKISNNSYLNNTLGKSFHEKKLNIQEQQISLIENMS